MEPTRTPKLAPYLAVHNARALVNFIKDALGGEVTYLEEAEGGRVGHAEVRVADSVVMVADTPEGRPDFPAMLHLYVVDADLAYDRALKTGASSVRPPVSQSDGDRRGGVKDAWGNEWWFTTLPNPSSKRG
jgi:uncharacterized glyoxalase superfamily protein PhnB